MTGVSPFLSPTQSLSKSRHDWYLISSALILMAIGLLALQSVDVASLAAHAVPNYVGSKLVLFLPKQAQLGALGLVGMVVLSLGNNQIWLRLSKVLWWINNILLGWVFFHGTIINHAKRWISISSFAFQPSDFTKVIIILTLASFYYTHQDEVRSWSTLGKSFLHILPSLAFLIMQPHYGGAACVFLAWLTVSLFAGVPAKHVLSVIGATIACLILIVSSPRLLTLFFHSYQIDRFEAKIESLLHPEVSQKDNSKGIAYQQAQSELAIALGSGAGEGHLKGERTNGRFVPEQPSDMVFSVIGEEFGFIGGLATLAAFSFFFYRVWLISHRSTDPMSQMIASGIFAVLAFHTVINLSMALNVSLTVGLWLPFMSAGGTALISCLGMVGILDSLD